MKKTMDNSKDLDLSISRQSDDQHMDLVEDISYKTNSFSKYLFFKNVDFPDHVDCSHRVSKAKEIDKDDAAEVYDRIQEYLESSDKRLVYQTCADNTYYLKAMLYDEETQRSYFFKFDAPSINLRGLGPDKSELEQEMQGILSEFDEFESGTDDESQVSLKFSYQMSHSVEVLSSRVYCPSWDDIKENYFGTTRSNLANIHSEINTEQGQLFIWHGEPGTGKTYALRSLIRAYQEDYIPLYITDVPKFMNNIAYYYQLIDSYSFNQDKNALFIFEDGADYLLEETRITDSEGMSKILNLTDGLLSQGREDLFLVTFNEDVQDVDPAIRRPGRCNSVVEFTKLDYETACAWMDESGGSADQLSQQEYTLAELYSILKGGDMDEEGSDFEFEDKAGF